MANKYKRIGKTNFKARVRKKKGNKIIIDYTTVKKSPKKRIDQMTISKKMARGLKLTKK